MQLSTKIICPRCTGAECEVSLCRVELRISVKRPHVWLSGSQVRICSTRNTIVNDTCICTSYIGSIRNTRATYIYQCVYELPYVGFLAYSAFRLSVSLFTCITEILVVSCTVMLGLGGNAAIVSRERSLTDL